MVFNATNQEHLTARSMVLTKHLQTFCCVIAAGFWTCMMGRVCCGFSGNCNLGELTLLRILLDQASALRSEDGSWALHSCYSLLQ